MQTQMPSPDDEAQSKRFIETAKELGADANSTGFEKAVKQIAPLGKKPTPTKKKPSSNQRKDAKAPA